MTELAKVTNKRSAKLLEKKLEELKRDLKSKCGRDIDKSFLFEVSCSGLSVVPFESFLEIKKKKILFF